MAGETGPIDVSLAIAMLIAGFFAISIYNSAEIFISLFGVFRRKQGLYFWSLMVATVGIFVHSIAVFLRFFALAPNLPMCVIVVIGWCAMVTGQSVVLYSRLGLMAPDRWKTQLALYMIIFNFVVLHIPVSALFIAINSNNPDPFTAAFDVYEKIQLVGFSIQESVLSGLYVWEASTSFKPVLEVKSALGRRLLRHLAILFVLTVLLDASLLATEFTNNFEIQTTYKPIVYSIKLKIEFVVLNELKAFTQTGREHDDLFRTDTNDLPQLVSAQNPRNEPPRSNSYPGTQPGSRLRLKIITASRTEDIMKRRDSVREPARTVD
jgi:hypothetical protein